MTNNILGYSHRGTFALLGIYNWHERDTNSVLLEASQEVWGYRTGIGVQKEFS